MKKTWLVFLALCGAAVLAGCGSTQKAAAAAPSVPDWVINGTKRDATGLYAVGEGNMGSPASSAKMARLQGRAELARILKSQIKTVTEASVQLSEGGPSSRDFSEKIVSTTDALLEGSEQVESYIDSKGTVYVLMYLPYESAVHKLNEAASNISGKTETLYTAQNMAAAYDSAAAK